MRKECGSFWYRLLVMYEEYVTNNYRYQCYYCIAGHLQVTLLECASVTRWQFLLSTLQCSNESDRMYDVGICCFIQLNVELCVSVYFWRRWMCYNRSGLIILGIRCINCRLVMIVRPVLEKIVGVSAKSSLSEFGIAPALIHTPWSCC